MTDEPQAVTCEYDGTMLTLTPDGREPACPTCEQDIRKHNEKCEPCRKAYEASAQRS